MSKVSIIMPAYNEGEFIKEAVESILAQSHDNWELLFLDDASSDNTLKIISTFNDPRISIQTNNENQGYLQSCNQLFELVSGEYITFLDADDTCPSHRLETCISALNNHNSDFLTTNFSKLWSKDKRELQQSDVDYNLLGTDYDYYPSICGATIFVKMELAKRIGGYHLIFDRMGAEDYNWLFRLSRAGKGIHLSDDLYHYRQHAHQIRNSQNPAHFVAHDLDNEIRKQLIHNGIDLLSSAQNDQLAQLKASLLSPFEKDETLILRYRSIQALNDGKWKEAISTMFKALFEAPGKMANWNRLAYLIYVMGRRTLQF